MSVAQPSPPSPNRKAASWFNAVVLAFALTACCVLVVMMTTRVHKRFDVTATRQHDLSPRTQQLLSRLDRDLTLVIAADLGSLDHGTRQRTLDIVEQFASASSRLKVNLINTSEPSGQKSYERVLADLALRDKPTVDVATAAVTAAIGKSEGVAATLEGVQRTLLKLKEQLVSAEGSLLNTQYLQTQAGAFAVAGQDLRAAVVNARSRLAASDPLIPVPAIDKALAELKKPVADASRALSDLADAFDSLAKDPRAGEQDKAAAGLLLPQLRSGRDAAGTLAAQLESVDIPRVLRIARALQQSRAALVIDDNAKPGSGIGIAAIDADTLLEIGEQGTNFRARSEDLIAGAIARMTSGVHPVVCIVHAGAKSLTETDWARFQVVRQQLSVRGIDFTEWDVLLERDLPTRVAVDSPARPVVFVTVSPSGGRELAQAISPYSKALNFLVTSGRNILLSVDPSTVPASGSPDPLTECLKPLGVEVDSGRPLLQTGKVETRTVVTPFQDNLTDPHASHTISDAARGLRLLLPWPVSINAGTPLPGVRVQPIVAIPADPSLWAESEWQSFFNAVVQARGDFRRIANPPAKDSPRDGTASGESWTVAMAVENAGQGVARQRTVIVGAKSWFIDDLVGQQASIYGRVSPVFAGNLQLFESSVHWLAGQDDQILRGASVNSTATIPTLSAPAQAWLRWLIIAIMPALALAAGVAYRALRP